MKRVLFLRIFLTFHMLSKISSDILLPVLLILKNLLLRIMKHLTFFYLLFFQISSWSQSDTARFVIRTAGFYSEYNEYEELKDSIAKKWDILYLPVAGCVSTTEFTDSINNLNSITSGKLIAHYGSDWKKRFDTEVDVAYTHLLYKKENTFREIVNCITEEYAFKASENLNQTELKFSVNPQKAGNQNNFEVRLLGLENVDPTILYRGYENRIVLEFGSLSDSIRVSIKAKGKLLVYDSCPAANKIRFRYRLTGSEKHDTLVVETSDGQVQQYLFNTSNLKNPEIYFNEIFLDSTLSISRLNTTSVLSIHYDRTCLVPDRFTVHTWEISHFGSKPLAGRGGIIPLSAIRKLKKLKPGTKCSLMITISSPDCILRKKIVAFTLI